MEGDMGTPDLHWTPMKHGHKYWEWTFIYLRRMAEHYQNPSNINAKGSDTGQQTRQTLTLRGGGVGGGGDPLWTHQIYTGHVTCHTINEKHKHWVQRIFPLCHPDAQFSDGVSKSQTEQCPCRAHILILLLPHVGSLSLHSSCPSGCRQCSVPACAEGSSRLGGG